MSEKERCPDVDGHCAIEKLRGGGLYVIQDKGCGVVYLSTVIIILTALGLIGVLTILTALVLIRVLTIHSLNSMLTLTTLSVRFVSGITNKGGYGTHREKQNNEH